MIQAAHPRIWLSPERLARCKARAAANDPRWLAVKAASDQYLTMPNPYGEPQINLGLAYQVTGDVRYANRAIELARPLALAGTYALTNAVAGVGQQSQYGYNARLVGLILSITYDWCYEAMTSEVRNLFVPCLKADADWCWPETNPARQGAYATENPGDNFFHGFLLCSWLAHLAIGDEAGLKRDTDRWRSVVLPHFKKYQAQGYPLEGTAYGLETLYRIWFYLDAHKTATGEDLIMPGYKLFDPDIVRHLTAPTLDRVVPFGDQAREKEALIADPTRLAALISTDQVPNDLLLRWLWSAKPNKQQWLWDSWQELLFARDTFTGSQPAETASVRLGGGVISRTSWQKDATALYVQCGPLRESHQDRAAGSFLLFKGDWIAGKAGLWGGNGILRETMYHNCVLCPPYDQPEFSGAEKAIQDVIGPVHDDVSVEEFEDTDTYCYAQMNLSNAYAYYQWNDDPAKRVRKPITNYVRELLWVKDGPLLVYDEIEVADPNQELVWCLQTKTSVSGAISHLLPVGAKESTAGVPQGPNGQVSSYRMEVRGPVGSPLRRFLNVLMGTGTLVLPTAGAAEFIAHTGNTVTIGWPDLSLKFVLPAGAKRIILLGLSPGDACTGSLGVMRLKGQASAAGVLSWDVPEGAAAQIMTITTGDVLPPPPPPPPPPSDVRQIIGTVTGQNLGALAPGGYLLAGAGFSWPVNVTSINPVPGEDSDATDE